LAVDTDDLKLAARTHVGGSNNIYNIVVYCTAVYTYITLYLFYIIIHKLLVANERPWQPVRGIRCLMYIICVRRLFEVNAIQKSIIIFLIIIKIKGIYYNILRKVVVANKEKLGRITNSIGRYTIFHLTRENIIINIIYYYT